MKDEPIDLLIEACFENLEKAEALIQKIPGIIDAKDGLGETALHYLAVENQLDAVKFLYKKGSALNTVNDCGGTPLSEAASLGYVDLVKWLLENGACVDGLFGTGEPILNEAVRSGNEEVVKLLVSYGADIHAKNSLNESPLHESAKDDEWLDVTNYLVLTGAKVNEVAAFHVTPLMEAALHGAIKTAKYLVGAGASSLIKDSKGRTPSQMARVSEHYELAKWLEAMETHKNPNNTNSADAKNRAADL